MSLETQAKAVCMILSDVDGVLTDGTIEIDHLGNESKRFSTLDGYGIKRWREAGYAFGLITGRDSDSVRHRAKDLHIEIVRTGTFEKLQAMEEIAAEHHLALEQIAYIGDDLPDLPAIRGAGLGVTVPHAPDELKIAADYVTQRPAGYGAIRDLIENILKIQKKWAN